jgi:probable phosphoglycerate mutase
MPGPVLYYVRHGQTDWNAEQRLQGQHDIPLNALGRAQAIQCGEILRGLFLRDGRQAGDFDYFASPLSRARVTMELLRGQLGLDPDGYRTDVRLMELSFGRWEGFTPAELQVREAEAYAARERDKWNFVLPGGESYAQLIIRVRAWHQTIARDAVVSAHGGVARALLAHFGIVAPEAAALDDIGQGVVYVFADGQVTRYG